MKFNIEQAIEQFMHECLDLYLMDRGGQRCDGYIVIGTRDIGITDLTWVGPRLSRDDTVELLKVLSERIDDGDWEIP